MDKTKSSIYFSACDLLGFAYAVLACAVGVSLAIYRESDWFLKSDVFAFLQKHKGSYDIIFADPPYHIDQKDFEKIPFLIFENDILDDEGMLIIEHSKDTKLEHLDNFSFARTYGGTTFSFFELVSDEDELDAVTEDDENDESE